MTKSKAASKPAILQVLLSEAKPNKMFSEWQREHVRFLTFNRAVACAECGRRSRYHWTALHSFHACDLKKQLIVLHPTGVVFEPFAPICRDHPFGLETWPSARPPNSVVEPTNDELLLVAIFDMDAEDMGGQKEIAPYVKSLAYNRPVPCHVCGKESTAHRMMLFSVCIFESDQESEKGTRLPPLSRICREHRYLRMEVWEEPLRA